jgi:anti-anti-sigma factor
MTDKVSIEGRITIDSSDEMRRQLRAIMRSRPAQVTVDLSGATFIDTSAVATLLEAARIARGQGTRLVLAGLRDQPAHLFKLTLLHQVFEIAGKETRA